MASSPSSKGPELLLLVALVLHLLIKSSQSRHLHASCDGDFYRLALKQEDIDFCMKLYTLGAQIGFKVVDTHNASSLQIKVIFGVPLPEALPNGMWVAWGVNPQGSQMAGTRALVGVIQANSSLTLNTYNVSAYTKLGCEFLPSDIDVGVRQSRIENTSGFLTISATLILPADQYDLSGLNHVWQVGYLDGSGTRPLKHPMTLANVDSSERLNMTDKYSVGVGKHRLFLRLVHGILNIVGWGIMLPVGAIIMRYFKEYPVTWRYAQKLHVPCQLAGYAVGFAGWVMGLYLGSRSTHYIFPIHRLIAILIFTFATLQILALRLHPKETDTYRKYWNMYHHLLGYALIAASAVNIFHGAAIMKPNPTWKRAYICIIGVLCSIVLVLEIYTWGKFVCEKAEKKTKI